MPTKRYKVKLTEEEHQALSRLISQGKGSARKLNHARILLEADEAEGKSVKDEEISEIVRVSIATVERVRKRFVLEGIESALNHKQPSGSRAKVLDGRAEAELVRLACSPAPEGRSRWTLQLLADSLVELEVVESISIESLRQGLKKMNLSLG